MTAITASHSPTAQKIEKLVDQMVEVFSNAKPEELLERVKKFKPLLKTITMLAKTLAITLKLQAFPRGKAQAAAEAHQSGSKFSEYSEARKQYTIKTLERKLRKLREKGHGERADKLEEAMKAGNYDQAIAFAKLYGALFAA